MTTQRLMTKDDALKLIDALPDAFDVEELHYRLYVWQKIQDGEADYEAGNFITQEELDREIDEWLK